VRGDGAPLGEYENDTSRYQERPHDPHSPRLAHPPSRPAGYKLVALKMVQASKELLEQHYADLSSKPFFPGVSDCSVASALTIL
jgi:hypothetical protein